MMENIPNLPVAYQWLIDRGLVGFEPFTQLQPWHYMHKNECFFANEKWPYVNPECLYVFARRQDNDDLACINFDSVGGEVIIIQGWTSSGFEIIQRFPDFWLWMQQVINDISEWVALS